MNREQHDTGALRVFGQAMEGTAHVNRGDAASHSYNAAMRAFARSKAGGTVIFDEVMTKENREALMERLMAVGAALGFRPDAMPDRVRVVVTENVEPAQITFSFIVEKQS
jgi:hypothetical protein